MIIDIKKLSLEELCHLYVVADILDDAAIKAMYRQEYLLRRLPSCDSK